MKIIFAHDHKFRYFEGEYFSTGGLSEDILLRYVEIFDNISVISRVVVRYFEDKNLSKIENSKISIINGYSKDNRKKFSKLIEESDAVIARLPSRLGNKSIKYALKNNKPYFIEMVGCAWDSYWHHSFLGKIFAPYMFLKTKSLIRNSPYTLYVTKYFLQNKYPCNGKTVSCSDVMLFDTDYKVLQNRLSKIDAKFCQNDKLIIGTIGALDVKYKGQEYIIKAIAALNQKGYRFEYHLVGGGNPSYLHKIAVDFGVSDSIKFIGTMNHNDINSFLDTIDIYAQPSSVEGLPRSLLEAMSRGCPSIGTKIGGIDRKSVV